MGQQQQQQQCGEIRYGASSTSKCNDHGARTGAESWRGHEATSRHVRMSHTSVHLPGALSLSNTSLPPLSRGHPST